MALQDDPRYQKAESATDNLLAKLQKSVWSLPILVVILIVVFFLGFCSRPAKAGERHEGPSAQGVTASAQAGAQAGVNAQSTTDLRAYGVGGTGLTSTGDCLGSISVLFGLGAGTTTEKGCVHRHYTKVLCDSAEDPNKCRFDMACLDPDLSQEVKHYIGCK